MKIFANTSNSTYQFEYSNNGEEAALYKDGQAIEYDLIALGNDRFSLIFENGSYLLHLSKKEGVHQVQLEGQYFPVNVEDERMRRLQELVKQSHEGPSEQIIRAPIPGLVVKVNVRNGQEVQAGEKLIVLEAMKMENIIKATCDCRVSEINVKEKDAVQQNQALLKLIGGE